MAYKKYSLFITSCLCLLAVFAGSYTEASPGVPITRTHQETLKFLVANSDMIAIVNLSGGTYKKRVTSSGDLPQKVNAKIFSIIKGSEIAANIEIVSTPKYPSPGSILSSVVLRNGRHLVFVAKKGEIYQPTTGFSLLDIFRNKVHPVWKERKNPLELSTGYELEKILNEIDNEIKTQ